MKRLALLLSLALVACFVVGLANRSVVGQEPVPIVGVLQGHVTLTPISVPDLIFQVNYHAAGRAQSMGRVTTDFISPQVQVDLVNRKLLVANPTWFVDLVVRNGDQLSGVYTFSTSVIEYSPLGFFAITADVDITGGTGRFAGADGTAEAFAVGNIFLGRYIILFEGQID